jgi:hypothetical protein
MTESKTSISKASSDAEIGEFWDHHDSSQHWDQTHEVEIQVDELARNSTELREPDERPNH